MNRFLVALALFTVACKAAIPAAPASPPPSARDVDVSGDKAPGFPDAIVEVDNCDLTGSRVFGELSGTIVRCPTDCASPAVYGGGVYDMSSSFCTALRHAGAISAERPLAYVEQVPAPRAMRGGEANGVRARDHRGRELAFLPHGVEADGSFAEPRAEAPNPNEAWLSCGTALGGVRLEDGETVTGHCPADCLSGGGLWGANPYTADSVICRAAVHAGAIGVEGGTVRFRRGSGAESYEAVTRNGTSSWAYRATGASLEIVVD